MKDETAKEIWNLLCIIAWSLFMGMAVYMVFHAILGTNGRLL